MGAGQQVAQRKGKSKSARTATKMQTGVRAARLWEVDTLRGMAVITMIIYHFGWDMVSFGLAAFSPTEGFWFLLQRYTCISFILLAGLSLTLTDRRLEQRGLDTRARFIHFLKRGGWVFFWGMVITVGMLFVGFRVDFGVLHLIGVSTVLAFPFLRKPWFALAGWLLLITLGAFTPGWNVETRWLVPLGLYPADYYVVDYFPLIPWFGVALLGVALGNWVYPAGQRAFLLPDWSGLGVVRGLRFLGRNSLPIYLVHQPILFGLLYLYMMLRIS